MRQEKSVPKPAVRKEKKGNTKKINCFKKGATKMYERRTVSVKVQEENDGSECYRIKRIGIPHVRGTIIRRTVERKQRKKKRLVSELGQVPKWRTGILLEAKPGSKRRTRKKRIRETAEERLIGREKKRWSNRVVWNNGMSGHKNRGTMYKVPANGSQMRAMRMPRWAGKKRNEGAVLAGVAAADRLLRGGPVAASIAAAGKHKYRWGATLAA